MQFATLSSLEKVTLLQIHILKLDNLCMISFLRLK